MKDTRKQFVQSISQADSGALTENVDNKLGLTHATKEKQLANNIMQWADGLFKPNGFDIETIAKINQKAGSRVKPFLSDKINHKKSFAETLELTNPSIGKSVRTAALKNKITRDKINQNPKEHDLPLRRYEIQEDPRIASGTGTPGYNVGF